MLWRKKSAPILPPEWLIVGLGNPGPEYAGTRHNVGFQVIDRLADKHRIKVKTAKHRALFGLGTVEGSSVVLAKPLTYMNLSGNAVSALARQHSIPPDHILVIADDLDLPVGTVRLKPKGGSGGHNGHKSIIAALKSEDYPRIKIGISSPGREEAIEHVLSKFRPDERPTVEEAIERASAACESIIREGVERAMNRVNVGQEDPEGESD